MNEPFSRLRLGSYELLQELAAGGMATVYVARQIGAAGFERLVVLKRVHPHLVKDKEFTNMFRDEARLASRVRHAKDRLQPAVASRIVCDVLLGLHAAHEAVDMRGARLDVVHRDVSPQN